MNSKVVHSTFSEGPLRGLKNGDRSVKMEIKPGMNIPTYHVLFGHKITLRYPGQKQTCARCYQTSQHCMGGGIARKCEAAGGERVEFCDFILGMWENIGYTPQEVEIASLYDDLGAAEEGALGSPIQQLGGGFTPVKVQSYESLFGGVMIKNIPADSDKDKVIDFILNNGLPQNLSDHIDMKENGKIYINNLGNQLCNELVKKLHLQKFG